MAKQKQANDGFYNALQFAASKELKDQAVRNAGLLALVGLGTGAAARGGVGLAQLVNSNVSKKPNIMPQAVPVDIPMDMEEEKVGGLSQFASGDYAQSVSGVPWAMPAAVAGGAAGLAGGWSAMDYLLDKRRKGELDAELDKAKAEYEAALMANSHKVAADKQVSDSLDALYEEFTKKADYWADMAGKATGAYGIGAGVAGLTSALLAYNWGKKRQRRALIDKALKERRQKRYATSPASMYVRPTMATPDPTKVGPPRGSSPSMQTGPTAAEMEGLDL